MRITELDERLDGRSLGLHRANVLCLYLLHALSAILGHVLDEYEEVSVPKARVRTKAHEIIRKAIDRHAQIGKRPRNVVSNPVAQTMASTSLCLPSVVWMPVGVMWEMFVAITSTLSWVRASR